MSEFVADKRLTKETLLKAISVNAQDWNEFPFVYYNYGFTLPFYLPLEGNEDDQRDESTHIPLSTAYEYTKKEAINFVYELAKFNGVKLTKKEIDSKLKGDLRK